MALIVVSAQLVAVTHQFRAQLADGRVGMVQEVVLGCEAFRTDVLGGLLQHLAVQGIVECQVVFLQVLYYVIDDTDGYFIALFVGDVAHDAFAIAHHHLQDEAFVAVEFLSFLAFLWDERHIVGHGWWRCIHTRFGGRKSSWCFSGCRG